MPDFFSRLVKFWWKRLSALILVCMEISWNGWFSLSQKTLLHERTQRFNLFNACNTFCSSVLKWYCMSIFFSWLLKLWWKRLPALIFVNFVDRKIASVALFENLYLINNRELAASYCSTFNSYHNSTTAHG